MGDINTGEDLGEGAKNPMNSLQIPKYHRDFNIIAP